MTKKRNYFRKSCLYIIILDKMNELCQNFHQRKFHQDFFFFLLCVFFVETRNDFPTLLSGRKLGPITLPLQKVSRSSLVGKKKVKKWFLPFACLPFRRKSFFRISFRKIGFTAGCLARLFHKINGRFSVLRPVHKTFAIRVAHLLIT